MKASSCSCFHSNFPEILFKGAETSEIKGLNLRSICSVPIHVLTSAADVGFGIIRIASILDLSSQIPVLSITAELQVSLSELLQHLSQHIAMRPFTRVYI